MDNSNFNSKPAMKYVDRGLELAVWANEVEQSDGSFKVVHSFTIQKNFVDADGKWRFTKNFTSFDLLALSELLVQVYRDFNIVKKIDSSFGD